MKLRDIYAREIERPINPAVVVSDRKKDTIKAEIEEYVFTDDLVERLYTMVDTVLNKREGKTGIWINGYYGSGKSHFIKYVHYLLDPESSDLAFERLAEAVANYDNMKSGNNDQVTANNLKLLKRRVDESNTDNIMFNVEDETDDGSQERLTRIFLNMLNRFRGYNSNDIPLAILLEKQLDKRGVFETFKENVEERTGFNWVRDAATLAAFQLQDVLEVAKELVPEIDTVSLHAKLSNPESFKVGISATLIPELQEFLKEKNDPQYRLLFLVDEVSQYVGTNKEVLLNFQNIIERVSDDCNNQVWIACTAQQTLDDVSFGVDGVNDVQDEFGKILGRFDTRISLQSSDASYITQRRVLDKNSTGVEYLTNLYENNKDYIENQFKINHDLFKGYQNEGEFIIGYPFVPYQLKLIAHVFEAFQQLQFVIKEVKDNERSVLGITHYTAKLYADEKVGGFIPFDAFFNNQFQTNLTHRGRKAIENGLKLPYVKINPFAERVVKVLFMISNLLENQRQTFPSNIENLGVLLMDTLDQNRLQLHNKIKEVLDELIQKSIIREEKGSYFFFNEDEMDVQNIIKNQVLISDDRLSTFDAFFRPLTKVSPKVSYGQNDFKMAYSIEGKEIYRNGDFELKVLITEKTPINQKALEVSNKDLVVCINEWFREDESLQRDFDWYTKTNKFLNTNPGSGTGDRARTIENFKIRNNELKNKIESSFQQKFSETRFISQNSVIDSDQINGSQAEERIDNLIEHHLSGIYKNHHLSAGYARNQRELTESVNNKQVPMQELTPAEQLVNSFITSHGNQITVYDLINEFEKPPFGWRFEAVLDVLVQLEKKKKREFSYNRQQPYPPADFIRKAVLTSERTSCLVVEGEEIDEAVLNEVIHAYKHIFNETLPATTDKNILQENLMHAIDVKLKKHQKLQETYFGKYPFGNCFKDGVNKLLEWEQIRDIKRLFESFIEEKETAKELFDLTKAMEDFASRALNDYNLISRFMRDNNVNLISIQDPEVLAKAKKINEFLTLEDPRRDFRHIRKAYEELQQTLNEFLEQLREKVKKLYTEAFAELEKEAAARNVDNSKYADKQYTLGGIDDTKSLESLKYKKATVDEFTSSQLQKIIAATPTKEGDKVAESATYYVRKGVTTISTEEEMNTYLDKVREEMTALLKDNKTIILK